MFTPEHLKLILLTAAATLFTAWFLHKKVAGWQISKNRKQGRTGELNAIKWLHKHGFINIKEQVNISFTWTAGKKIITSKIRPDILAQKNGVEWLIEVKTGDAASLKNTKTRRQLREYSALFPDKRCALFDATGQKFYEINFDSENIKQRHQNIVIFKTFIYGTVTGILLAWLLIKLYL